MHRSPFYQHYTSVRFNMWTGSEWGHICQVSDGLTHTSCVELPVQPAPPPPHFFHLIIDPPLICSTHVPSHRCSWGVGRGAGPRGGRMDFYMLEWCLFASEWQRSIGSCSGRLVVSLIWHKRGVLCKESSSSGWLMQAGAGRWSVSLYVWLFGCRFSQIENVTH